MTSSPFSTKGPSTASVPALDVKAVITRLWLWFWFLLPANPILIRVVQGGSRRSRHLWLRFTYLTALLMVVLLSMFFTLGGRAVSLTELAKGASQTFQWASTTQLILMCFLAPVFTAGAITQERDAQTMNILLATPLSNAQIVFGSLTSRLYFVIVLLLAGLPIFLITMVFGGVTATQVLQSFALSGATAILTGALAILIAMMGVGGRRTIFSFYLIIALPLLTAYLLGQSPSTWSSQAPANISGQRMSVLAPINPFLALEVALNQTQAPEFSALTQHSAPIRYALAYPSAAYFLSTAVGTLLLTLTSVLYVRRGAKVGEMSWKQVLWNWLPQWMRIHRVRKPRTVWQNPVAWREARTRAAGGAWFRWLIVFLGSSAYLVLFMGYAFGSVSDATARKWLAGLTAGQLAIALIFATNTAATAMTREKEAKTLDLLLTTPVTSRFILWGKLRGLVSFALPILSAPVVALVAFALLGVFRGGDNPAVVPLEAPLGLGCLMVVYTACACVVGLRYSMTSRKNVQAVMFSIGSVIAVGALSWAVIYGVVQQVGGQFAAFFVPFSPFTAVFFILDPVQLFEDSGAFAAAAGDARTASVIGSGIALAIFTFVVYTAYHGLVRSFDMTMRKQTGT